VGGCGWDVVPEALNARGPTRRRAPLMEMLSRLLADAECQIPSLPYMNEPNIPQPVSSHQSPLINDRDWGIHASP